MTKSEFRRAVARATGESLSTIKNRGFSPLSFELPHDDGDDHEPVALDWDTRQPMAVDRLAA
jgi:hypothetical protein